MGLQQAAEGHDQVLRELNEERAAALMRISRTLESLIDQLYASRGRLAHIREADRARELAVYQELRRSALRYRWYLEVQREALGLRHHQLLDEFYTIPGRIER